MLLLQELHPKAFAYRRSFYQIADVVVMVFDIDSLNSLKKIEDEWLEELSNYKNNVPWILVSTKSGMCPYIS